MKEREAERVAGACPEVEGCTAPPDARTRLLRAAETLFAEKGYAATAVHEITSSAGVNRALLYYYFEDKHDLYRAVIADGAGAFDRLIDRTLGQPGTFADRLDALVRGHLELTWERAAAFRVLHRCLLDGHQDEFGLVENTHSPVTRLEEFIRAAIVTGECRPLDPAVAARTFLGPSFLLFLWRMCEGEQGDPQTVIDTATALVRHGLLPDSR